MVLMNETVTPIETTKAIAMDMIHEILDGEEWDPSTIERVADVVREAGYEIRPPHGQWEEDE